MFLQNVLSFVSIFNLHNGIVFSGRPKHLFGFFHEVLQASLIVQLVKNLPAMQETQVQFLGQEDLLEKG